jgi:ABC-type uncharacterized transport system substrate-binding protein
MAGIYGRGKWFFLVAAVIFLVLGCTKEKDKEAKSHQISSLEKSERVLTPPLENRKRILVLHSYHAEFVWVQDVNKGILQALQEERFDERKNITIEYFYMDTKRKTDEAWKMAVAKQAMEKIRSWKPQVVMAADDNAQAYVVSKMKDSGFNFVFLGVNADPMQYGFINSMEEPGGKVTGSIERERFEQSVMVLRKLVPNVHRLSIICDDGPTGVPIIQRVKRAAPAVGTEIVDVLQTGNFSRWKEFVSAQQGKVDALLVVLYHTLKDEAGNPVHEDRVLNWTLQNSRLPDIGFWSWAVQGGLLCSEAISGFQQGYYAGTVAAYVLRGQEPGEFRVDKPQRGEVCVNAARAKMLGIAIPQELSITATIYPTIGSSRTGS